MSDNYVKIEDIKRLIKIADDLHEIAREMGTNAGMIEDVSSKSFTMQPFVIIGLIKEKLLVDVEKKGRKKEIIEGRQLAIYFLRRYTKISLNSIARYVCLKDHSTVLHHYRVFQGYLKVDERTRTLVREFEEAIFDYYETKNNLLLKPKIIFQCQ